MNFWRASIFIKKIVLALSYNYNQDQGGQWWIGLQDPGKNGNWQWTDETKLDYQNWDPDDFGESGFCGQLDDARGASNQWIKRPCEMSNCCYFFCSMNARV